MLDTYKRQENYNKKVKDFENLVQINASKTGIPPDIYKEYLMYAKTHGDEAAKVQLMNRLNKLAQDEGFGMEAEG